MVAGRNITDLALLAQFVLLAPVLPVLFHLLALVLVHQALPLLALPAHIIGLRPLE
jgi:hypothetical protein